MSSTKRVPPSGKLFSGILSGSESQSRSRRASQQSSKHGGTAVKIVRGFKALYGPASIALLISILVGFAVFGRIPPVIVKGIVTTTPQVKPGDYFIVDQQVEWKRGDCTNVVISADFVDSLKFHHNTALINVGSPHYGQDHVLREWQVPFTMPWGPTIYKSQVTFECFPFYWTWPITMELVDVSFTVVDPNPNSTPGFKLQSDDPVPKIVPNAAVKGSK